MSVENQSQNTSSADATQLVSVKILLVENEPLWQVAIKQLLSSMDGVVVCGVCDNYQGSLALYRDLAPDIVLLDWQINSSETGIDVGLALRSVGHPLEKLILITASSPLSLPAHPFLMVSKSKIAEDLCPLIQSII